MTKRKRTKDSYMYDLQNTTQKTKDKALRTPQKLGGERKQSLVH